MTWVLLKPFLTFLILYLVFSFVFGAKDPNYRLNLLLGIIIFSFFSEATSRGLSSLYDRSGVILKINFPRQIAILAPIINSLINLLLSLIIFFIFWSFTPTPITVWWPAFLFYILLLTVCIVGFSFFTSILFIKIRDLSTIWEVLLSLLFYATPIIYPISMIPDKYYGIMMLNPITSIIRDARLILIQGQPPGLYSIAYVGGLGIFMLVAGYWYFNRNIRSIAEEF